LIEGKEEQQVNALHRRCGASFYPYAAARLVSAVAIAPEEVVATRRRLLNRAAAEKALVLASHFPFPGLDRVVQEGEGWQWRPI